MELRKINIDNMKPIAVSFKKNEEDFELYKWILSHSGYSGFIKDLLKEAMKEELGILTSNEKKQPRLVASEENQAKSLINLDF